MEEFVYNLKLSQGLKPSSFKEIHYSVITNIIKALIFILPSFYIYNIHTSFIDNTHNVVGNIRNDT